MLLSLIKQNIKTGWQVALNNTRYISSVSSLSATKKYVLNHDNILASTPIINGVLLQQVRYANSFFNKSQNNLDALLSVSNAGRRRGRGRGTGKKIYKDLNRGQFLGTGEKQFIWPGLNAPIVKNGRVLEHQEQEPDPEFRNNLYKFRDQAERRTRASVHPLERGWSGKKTLGKWIGPPDPISGEKFQGFDTKIIVMKPIFYMKPNFGRSKLVSVLTVTGNGKGLVGYAFAKSKDMRTAIDNSKNKAGQRLFQVNLDIQDGGNTVLHDFVSRFGYTTVFVEKKPPGYGLSAHRSIRAICSVLGITDIKATIEGGERNYLAITRAFLLGLINQKTFQTMAEDKRLNVVEFRNDLQGYPILKARPIENKIRSDKHIGKDEILDFDIYIHDGMIKQPEVHKELHYTKHKGWINYMKKYNYRKDREQVRVQLIAKYGQIDSHFTIRERQRLQAKREQFLANNPQQRQEDEKQETAEA